METRAMWAEVHGDGAPMSLYVVSPAAGAGYPGLLYCHTVLGINDQHKAMAARIAAQGYVVVMPDLYYRLGQRIVFEPTPDRTARAAAADSLTDYGLTADARATLNYMKDLDQLDAARLGVIGYCLGGRIAFLIACLHPDVKASAVAYGSDVARMTTSTRRPVPLLDLVDGVSGPMLHLSGDADENPSPADVAATAAAMSNHGKHFEHAIYDGAGHAFFDEDIPVRYHLQAATLGWARKLDFLKTHLQGVR